MFQSGTFTSHSGLNLKFKIECDTLTDADYDTLAEQIIKSDYIPAFYSVVGVPKGGLQLAAKLHPHVDQTSDWTLIVDDVLTTGNSMEAVRKSLKRKNVIGLVIFARGTCPRWVLPMFSLHEAFWGKPYMDHLNAGLQAGFE